MTPRLGGEVDYLIEPLRVVAGPHHAPERGEEMPGSRATTQQDPLVRNLENTHRRHQRTTTRPRAGAQTLQRPAPSQMLICLAEAVWSYPPDPAPSRMPICSGSGDIGEGCGGRAGPAPERGNGHDYARGSRRPVHASAGVSSNSQAYLAVVIDAWRCRVGVGDRGSGIGTFVA